MAREAQLDIPDCVIPEEEEMQVIVATGLNNGDAEYRNIGDIAMLEVAVARLSALWPAARVHVLTDSPSNLKRYCRDATPLPRRGCSCLVDDGALLGRYHAYLPKTISTKLSSWKKAVGRRSPGFIEKFIQWRLGARDSSGRRKDFEIFIEALRRADLLVVCGAGGFANSCQEWNLAILGTMEAAISRGIPVAMLGQGMGPLSDEAVLNRARQIFPEVDLITLRGSRDGLALLQSLGVDSGRVTTTGDDAIELAYQQRVKEPGAAIGINLRVAPYAGVGTDPVGPVRSALESFAERHTAPLAPLPIAFHEYANDPRSIRQLLSQIDATSDGGASLETPRELIEQTARCRIVVTGAYHAAVFALAQGIPAVCLTNSSYYLAKFQGLQDHFGAGCEIVTLADPEMPAKLAGAMEAAWNSAEAVRAPLLEAALRQVEHSRRVYDSLRQLVAARRPKRSMLRLRMDR
jgi:polysaccharide pyruvyl transferase WcaK-like protein